MGHRGHREPRDGQHERSCGPLPAGGAPHLPAEVVADLADGVDLGVFSRENGIREFDGSNAETKNALFNWGLGAVAYLVVGRLLERVIKP